MAIRSWLVVLPLEIAVDSVRRGVVQMTFGQRDGVARLGESDGIVLYCPKTRYPDGEPLRKLVATGFVTDAEPWRAASAYSRSPWRRSVDYDDDRDPIDLAPLRSRLDLTERRYTWGEQLRHGITELSAADFDLLRTAMRRTDPGVSSFVLRQLDAGLWAPKPLTTQPQGDEPREA